MRKTQLYQTLGAHRCLHIVEGKPHPAQLVPFRVAETIYKERAPHLGEVTYHEADRFLKGDALKRGPLRQPIVTICGHIAHGKTTLLDSLQKSALCNEEPGRITQTIRAFSVPVQKKEGRPTKELLPHMAGVTFVDTPGHQVFSEIRLHGQQIADIVLIVVALDEGVQTQTAEVVYAAVEKRKQIVFAFNKVDLFTDLSSLSQRLNALVMQLQELKVEVAPIVKLDEVEKTLSKKTSRIPALCISGLTGTNLDVLLDVLTVTAAKRVKKSAPTEGGCRGDIQAPLQACVLESFRDKGTEEIVVSTIVRSGIARRGQFFIVDRNHGQISKLTDQWGRVMKEAHPGLPVNIWGLRRKGLPAAMSHVMEMRGGREETVAVANFRAMLLWYVERFPKHLHLLRPPGHNVDFLHVGNFGQLKVDDSLEFRTEYGAEGGDGKGGIPEGEAAPKMPQQPEPGTGTDVDPHLLTPRKELRVCLNVDTWHSGRMLMKELNRMSKDHTQVVLLSLDVGQINKKHVQRALGAKADYLYAFKVICEDAEAAHFAADRGLEILEYSVFLDVLEHVRLGVEAKNGEWADDDKRVKRQGFVDSFVQE